MQSLGLDVKVLSDDNQEIEILDSSDYDTVGGIDQIIRRESMDDDMYDEPMEEPEDMDKEPEDFEDFDETLDLDGEFSDEF